VILSVLMCDIWINVSLQTSALVGPLHIEKWNGRWNNEINLIVFLAVLNSMSSSSRHAILICFILIFLKLLRSNNYFWNLKVRPYLNKLLKLTTIIRTSICLSVINLISKFHCISKFLHTCLLPYSATCCGMVVQSWGRPY
jgi:hypothetical protein